MADLVLKLNAFAAGTLKTTDVIWKVDLDDGTSVELKGDGDVNLTGKIFTEIRILGKPNRNDLHPHRIRLKFSGQTISQIEEDEDEQRWFISGLASGNKIVLAVTGFFSRLKDVTKRVAGVIRAGDTHGPRTIAGGFDRAPSPLPADWTLPGKHHHFLDPANPVSMNRFQFVEKDVDPMTEEFVFAVAGHELTTQPPSLLAVSWPKSILTREVLIEARRASSSPEQMGEDGLGIPFLIFYGAAPGEFTERMKKSQDAFDWDWVFFQFWRSLNFQHDAIFERTGNAVGRGNFDAFPAGGGFGIPYQIASAGKRAVVVVPMGGNPGGRDHAFGMASHVNGLEDLLLNVLHFVMTKKTSGVELPPRIGRVAISGWSRGANTDVFNIMVEADTIASDFGRRLVKEAYLMDPGSGTQDRVFKRAKAWANRDSNRLIRFYGSQQRTAFGLFGLAERGSNATIENAGQHILAWFPSDRSGPFEQWAKGNNHPGLTDAEFEAHFLMPALCFGHAAANSKF